MVSSLRRPSSAIRIFSSAEYCLRVAHANGAADENAARLEHVVSLGNDRVPVFQQVQDTEPEHGIEGPIADAEFIDA